MALGQGHGMKVIKDVLVEERRESNPYVLLTLESHAYLCSTLRLRYSVPGVKSIACIEGAKSPTRERFHTHHRSCQLPPQPVSLGCGRQTMVPLAGTSGTSSQQSDGSSRSREATTPEGPVTTEGGVGVTTGHTARRLDALAEGHERWDDMT
jgi:hypothetical protein